MSRRWWLVNRSCRIIAGVLILSAFMACFLAESTRATSPTVNMAVTDDSLFTQTAARVLKRDFSAPEISYLLLDIRSRTIVAKQWENERTAIPVGSLVKPFTAIAYARSHSFRFPEFVCTPGACWYPRGHGRLGIVKAVAVSCNAYFGQLASELSAEQVRFVANTFGLNGPPDGASAGALAGERGVWRESPEALAKAYAELIGSRGQPGIREIVEGMLESARSGTASGLAKEASQVTALAKTGTAPCTHRKRAPGDGFVVVAWPGDSPQYLLLVRYHGNPGAHAAELAGRMLHTLQP